MTVCLGRIACFAVQSCADALRLHGHCGTLPGARAAEGSERSHEDKTAVVAPLPPAAVVAVPCCFLLQPYVIGAVHRSQCDGMRVVLLLQTTYVPDV